MSDDSSRDADAAGDLGFSFHARGSGVVELRRHGRPVATLRGEAARDFLADVASRDHAGAQRLMARLTGNYKRGNERVARRHPRNRG